MYMLNHFCETKLHGLCLSFLYTKVTPVVEILTDEMTPGTHFTKNCKLTMAELIIVENELSRK